MTKTIEFTFIIKMMDFNLLTIGFQKNRTKSNSYLFIYFSSEMLNRIERNKSKMAVVDRC